MSTFNFANSRSAEIIDAACARADASPEGADAAQTTMKLMLIIGFKARLSLEMHGNPEGLASLNTMFNLLVSTLFPELGCAEVRAEFTSLQKTFLADLKDLRNAR